MENFKLEVGGDGVAIVTFDMPNRSMNVISQHVQADIDQLTTRIKNDETIRGAVICSGKANNFCVGADLPELSAQFSRWRSAESQEDRRQGVSEAAAYSLRLRALATSGKPTAAAISGLTLGGGLELALACTFRFAADDQSVTMALPEATIGLMPGAGATQRLSRLMGVERSLPHLLNGTSLDLSAAVKTGVLTGTAPATSLIDACRQAVLTGDPQAPWDRKGFSLPGGTPHSEAGYRSLPFSVATVAGAHGTNRPALANILRSVYEGVLVPIDAGLRIESRYFFNSVRTSQAAAMVNTLFAARQRIGKNQADTTHYVEQLRLAWNKAAADLVQEGASASLVKGVARRIGGWTPDLASASDRHLHLPEKDTIAYIGDELLRRTALKASGCLADGLIANADLANLSAVEAGFPAWTGGPLSYLAQRVSEPA